MHIIFSTMCTVYIVQTLIKSLHARTLFVDVNFIRNNHLATILKCCGTIRKM